MDPGVVAAYYQGKGYSVRQDARVPGLSGNEHKVPLLAEGPLGSLAVFFGDFGGVDGPEMGGARKVARDVGATPVLAADSFSNQDRQVAARLGVVLLDGSMLEEDPGPAPAVHPDAVPWPSLQARGAPGPASAPSAPSGPARPSGPTGPSGPAGSSSLRSGAEEHPWPASGRVGGRDGPGAAAVDIDDLLAETRRPRPRAEPLPADGEPAVVAPSPTPAPAPAAPAAQAAAPAPDEGADAGALWKRPRRPGAAVAPPGPPPAAPTPRPGRFAWLGAEGAAPAPRRPRPGHEGDRGGDGFAVDYDGVVATRAPAAQEPASPAAPDAGQAGPPVQEPSAAESWEQRERRERHDRLLRRLFWALFAFAILSFLWLFWNNKIGN